MSTVQTYNALIGSVIEIRRPIETNRKLQCKRKKKDRAL